MTNNGRVLVCVASRDRNLALVRMIQSVLQTSEKADVAIYIDDDQYLDYWPKIEPFAQTRGIYVLKGPRIGPVASLNAIAEKITSYSVYAAATDDSEYVTPGWDQWLLETAEAKQGFAVMGSCIPGSNRLDFPCVTRGWIDAIGHFAYPGAKHFYWDVFLEVIADEVGCLVQSTSEQFLQKHDDAPTEEIAGKLTFDGSAVLTALAKDRKTIVEKMRKARPW